MCQSLWLLTDVYYIPTVASLGMVVNGMIDRPATGDRLLPDLLMPDRFATYAQTRGIDP
jgi:hypothetical protein